MPIRLSMIHGTAGIRRTKPGIAYQCWKPTAGSAPRRVLQLPVLRHTTQQISLRSHIIGTSTDVGRVVEHYANHLTPESRARYRSVDLHFHDLRREFGSRVLESGSSLVEARDLLGHSNIAQTSTYLQSTAKSLGLAIEKKEAYEQQLAEARRQHEADEKKKQEETAQREAQAADAPVPEGSSSVPRRSGCSEPDGAISRQGFSFGRWGQTESRYSRQS